MSKYFSTLSIRTMLYLSVVIPLIGLVMLSGQQAWISYNNYNQLVRSTHFQTLANAGGEVAQSVPDEVFSQQDEIPTARKRTDAAYEAVLSAQEAATENGIQDSIISENIAGITASWKALVTYRKNIDAANGNITPELRNTGVTLAPITAAAMELTRRAGATADDLELSRLIQGYYALLKLSDSGITDMALGEQYLRNGALTPALQSFFVADHRTFESHTDAVFEFLPPEFTKPLDEFLKGDENQFMQGIREKISFSQNEMPDNAAADRWMKNAGYRLGLFKTILSETDELLRSKAAEKWHEAQFKMLSYCVLAIASVLLSTLFSLRCISGISRPLRRLTVTMGTLADNDLSVDIPFADRRDEIGEMARAVEVFKQNGIRVREMNAQEAALQAKSADLQSSIGQVVSAAVAGDFTQRIAKDYENADLNRFAASVNELVASVDRGVAETRRVISALAEGDLTESMRGEFQGAFGELQGNVNATMANLRSVLGKVRAAIDTINGGAGAMRNASGDLSKRTEQQAASLEETSSALEEITVAVKNSTERATEASHMVDEARKSTEQSSAVVTDAVSAMGRIDRASGEIGQIINVIDEIAFQTNLLALNAGVEAARAGDAGKGFAVVAQEVRELAQRSAGAAKDIKALISRSSGEVQSGVKLVTATGEALTLIQGHVVKINEHVHSIARAAKEQSTGLSEVSTAVNHMDQVTQQNAAMVEESTAAATRLAEEASNLARLIARFKLGGVSSVPRAVGHDSRPVASPARALGQKIAGAFGGGRTATAAAASEWEEF